MKSTIDQLEGLSRKINIEVPAAQVQESFNKMYQQIQKTAELKGFRKGKAPLSTVKSMYADRVRQDVMQNLVSHSFHNALDEHSVHPIGNPNFHIEEFEENADFKFSAEFEIRPEVDLKKVEGLKIESPEAKVEDQQIEDVIQNILKQQQNFVPIFEDRPLQKGDVAKVDFDGFINGAPLEGGQAKDHMLEIGSNSFIEGFEEGLEGMKPGQERELNLSFPKEYHAAQLAGQPVTFKVTLKEINKKELPELNDEFAQGLGEDFKTVDDLKEAIKKDLLEGEQRKVEDEKRQNALKALVEANPIEVPKKLHEQQKQTLIVDTEQRLKQQGMSPEDIEEYKKKWNDELESSASFLIQSTFLVDAVADKNELRVNDDDVHDRIKEQAKNMNIDYQKVHDYYHEQDRYSQLKFQMTQEKVVDYLLEKSE